MIRLGFSIRILSALALTPVSLLYAQTYSLTVVNGTGSGSYKGGASVSIAANVPPTGDYFSGWTGATVANSTASTTTLTMPSANTTVTAHFSKTPVVPYPVTTHPRLWVTTQDLPRLQSWATSTNPIYAQGLANTLQQAVTAYQTQFFPNGSPNSTYPDPGDTQGYTGLLTEQYGAILAFNSLIDPSAANRIKYAQYARNLLMYAMNQAAQGVLANAPFRDPAFPIYNRANGSGEQWPLIVDWIYNAKDAGGNAILTASDKLTIRNVFMTWATACLNAETTGGDHPSPVGVTNSLALLPGNVPYRMASNNYYLGHARLLTMMALSIDPADDPALNKNLPVGVLGNSLRSYLLDALGAWLYQEYAMMGEPANVAPEYGISGTGGFGLANGGLPPEGMLYGHSFAYVLGQLLALQTAGFHNGTLSGPQINLITAPIWSRYVTGMFSSLVPTAQTFSSQSWLGPVYQYGSYGDLLRLWATPDFMQPFALLTLLEGENGKTTDAQASRWFAINGVEGGEGSLMTHITDPWSWSSTQSILYFMLMDPKAGTPADPRPSLPLTFYDQGAGRAVSHSAWGANSAMFDYRSSWESINHQDGNAGQFEIYRNGEWLTKEMSNYDNNGYGFCTEFHNTLSLQNWSAQGTPDLSWFENGEWSTGSQWILGENAGDPMNQFSVGSEYLYANSNITNLYNRPDIWTPAAGATDVKQATRSILWLSPYAVIYDRATTNHSGLFKRFNLSLVNSPTISGNVATETMADGQQLFVTTLLPANPSYNTFNGASMLNPVAQLEPTQYIMQVEDPTLPADTRFLHVLQGANKGVAATKAVYVTSASGTPFDGVWLGSDAVFFPTSTASAVATTTFNVKPAVNRLYVTGLTPSTAYGVAIATTSAGFRVTVTPGGTTMKSDPAGLLQIAL